MQVNIILNCHPSRKCRYFNLQKIILRLRMIFLVSNLRFYSLLINFFTDKKLIMFEKIYKNFRQCEDSAKFNSIDKNFYQ